MRYEKKFAGKWVAVKKSKVIASSKSFSSLQKKISTRRDVESIRFSLIPSGMITGSL